VPYQPPDPITPRRVLDVLKRAYNHLQAHRSVYYTARAQFAGPWHGSAHDPLTRWDPVAKGAAVPFCSPVNRMSEMLEAYLPNLTGTSFDTTLTPQRAQLKNWALLRQLRINQVLRTAGVAEVDEAVVQDAVLSGQGCYLVGLNAGSDMLQVSGALSDRIEPNTPFVTRIPPSCVIKDPTAGSDQTRGQFAGHIYVCERQRAIDLGLDADLVQQLPCAYDAASRMVDDPAWKDTTGHIDDWLFDHVLLVDVILYSGQKAYKATLPPWGGPEFWLCEPQEWTGADKGRYEWLTLRSVNDVVAPKSPAQDLMDMHLACAQAAGKMVRQILKTGRRYLYNPDQEDTAIEIRDGREDEWVQSDNPDVFKDLTVGGLMGEMVPGYQWLTAEAEQSTINPQQASGRVDSSKTATGASLMAGRADRVLGSIRAKRDTALNFVARRIGMALDEGDDRKRILQRTYTVGGRSIPVELLYDPARREAAFDQFDYSVQVTTVQSMDPRQKQRGMAEFMVAAPPWIQFVAMAGGNVSAAMRLMQKTYEQPEIGQIFPTQDILMAEQIMKSLAPDVMGGGMGPRGIQQLGKSGGSGGGTPGQVAGAQVQSDYSRRVPA